VAVLAASSNTRQKAGEREEERHQQQEQQATLGSTDDEAVESGEGGEEGVAAGVAPPAAAPAAPAVEVAAAEESMRVSVPGGWKSEGSLWENVCSMVWGVVDFTFILLYTPLPFASLLALVALSHFGYCCHFLLHFYPSTHNSTPPSLPLSLPPSLALALFGRALGGVYDKKRDTLIYPLSPLHPSLPPSPGKQALGRLKTSSRKYSRPLIIFTRRFPPYLLYFITTGVALLL